MPCWRHWSQNALVYPLGLVAVHWAGFPHSWPYVPGSALVHRCIVGFSCGRATVPATTLGQGLALVLSGCGDWDNPAGYTVGLLCLGAVGSKAYDLAAVCPLA